MYEAAQTNVSAAGIWAIVAVAVACLAFWLIAIAFASRDPGVGHPHTPDLSGPVLGGMHVSDCARSVSPSRDSAATFADSEADAFAAGARTAWADASEAGGAETGDAETGDADAPARPTPGATPVPSPRAADQPAGTQTKQPSPTAAQNTPGQRTADADQPRHTGADR
jgi:hypothetical protein